MIIVLCPCIEATDFKSISINQTKPDFLMTLQRRGSPKKCHMTTPSILPHTTPHAFHNPSTTLLCMEQITSSGQQGAQYSTLWRGPLPPPSRWGHIMEVSC